jgi:hypothetical protein
MVDLTSALADYIAVLAASADRTTRAEDRSAYTRHLSEAARMFADLHGRQLDRLRERVAAERHAYGWSYLSGDAGEAAEAAFDALARRIEAEMTPPSGEAERGDA